MRRHTGRAAWGALVVMGSAALGVIEFFHPSSAAPTHPFAAIAEGLATLHAGASANAFGVSGQVRLRFALPGDDIEFPLEVSGDPASLAYEWVTASDSASNDRPQPLVGSSVVAPRKPGIYHLVVVRGAERQVIPEPALAVMVPFREKVGGMLNGYRIGTYLAERLSHHDHPAGFIQVGPGDVDLQITRHLRLGDFLTHDRQREVWPKYVALSPRILDKLELVLQRIGANARLSRASDDTQDVAFDVHSGFRTPAHNRGVWRSAHDSRHEYGDAADVAIDADGDGHVTLKDERLVARAVDEVEAEHPDLVGGLGLYTSRHYRTPYVHIDARGKRSRWRG